MPRDYYEMLGVSRGADTNEIKSAYRRLAKKYHPDVSQEADAEEKLKELNEAYGVLSDSERRAHYDRSGHAGVDGAAAGSRTGRSSGSEPTKDKGQTKDKGRTNNTESTNGTEWKKRTKSSERQQRTETPRRDNMGFDSTKYQDGSDRFTYVKTGCGLAFVGIVILFILSPQIASFFLSLSHAANQTAHNEVLESFLDPRPTYTLRPTYTPLATHTALPTYTPLPTHTPRPTYTPFPTPTLIPPAVIVQHIEDQAQLVVVQNEMSNPSFHVGVNVGACSHGGDFIAHGVIEAGIDFSEIDEDSVTYNSNSQTYTLKLPAPEFTSCRIEYIRLIKVSFSMCNPDWDQARTLAEVQVMREFIDESLEIGLLEEAEERSELILGDFVRTFTGKRVNVTFEKQGRNPRRDASCSNFSTGSWHYNKAQNFWQERG